MHDVSSIARDPRLRKHIDTLQSLSRDNSHEEFLTDSTILAIGFDKVKKEYTDPLRLTETPCSVDALCLFENDSLVFVEFKNGRLNSMEVFGLRKKVYDSLLIFQDISGINLTTLRSKATLVLVFRKDLNPAEGDDRQSLPMAPSRDKIVSRLFELADKELIRFDLERFKSYCFKDVHTYSPEEFDTYLQNKKSIL